MYLLFDIGGTNIRLAVSIDGKRFNGLKIVPTPQNFSEGVKLIASICSDLTGGERIKLAAGGVAGPMNRARTKLVGAPNISRWNNKPLKKELQKYLKAPVLLENDTALIGLGEAVVGAGRGQQIVAYITFSTGIGGARIVDGKIDPSAMGFEPGHQIINCRARNSCLPYGASGDLESYASGGVLQKRYKKPAYKITDKKIWRRINHYLACGLHNAIVFWSPDIIVLGGGFMQGENIDINIIRRRLKKTFKKFPKLPLIKRATLKNVGGFYGALELIKRRKILTKDHY